MHTASQQNHSLVEMFKEGNFIQTEKTAFK